MSRKASNWKAKRLDKKQCLDLLEKAQQAFFIINLQTHQFEFISSAIKKITGYTAEEIVIMGTSGLNKMVSAEHRCDMAKLFNPEKRQARNHVYIEMSFKHKKGHYVWLGINRNLTKDDNGKTLVLGSISDISVQKMVEEKLESLKTLYYNAQVAMYRTRVSDGKMLECNQSLARMLGYQSREHCLSKHYSKETYANPRQREELLKALKQLGQIDNFEVQARRVDGSPLWMKISAREYPKKAYLEGTICDITAEKTLTATEKQILKEIMLGKSSKEIAYQFKRSIRTIEDHRANIMRKLGVHNLVELAQKAMETMT